MIRTYTPTGGRAIPSRRSLDVATLLIADPHQPRHGLDAHGRSVMQLCLPGQLSVAEVSAHLQLPIVVTKVVVADLADSGHLITRDLPPPAQQHDRDLLERILDGLHKI